MFLSLWSKGCTCVQLLSGKLGKEMLSLFFKNLHKSALEIAGLSTNQEGIFPVFPYFPAQLGQGSAEYLSNQNREWGESFVHLRAAPIDGCGLPWAKTGAASK